jgi:hypothetical protein
MERVNKKVTMRSNEGYRKEEGTMAFQNLFGFIVDVKAAP